MFRKEYNIIWKLNALVDIRILINYISQDNPQRGVSFLNEIREKVNMLSHYPNMGRNSQVLGMRELVVHKNYIVYYYFFHDTVYIAHVKHAARDSFY